MSRGIDYSKWNNIELSDDEDDVPQFIEKNTWKRLKHRTRVEREAKEEQEKASLINENKADEEKIKTLLSSSSKENEEEVSRLRKAIAQRTEKLEEMERNKKWNADNMCHVVEERTIISGVKDVLKSSDGHVTASKAPEKSEKVSGEKGSSSGSGQGGTKPEDFVPSLDTLPSTANMSEQEEYQSYDQFVKKHKELLDKFSKLRNFDESRQYLQKHGAILLHQHASGYLLLSSLEHEMAGKNREMRVIASQSQIISSIIELSESMHRDPRDVVIPFFQRIGLPEQQRGFKEAVENFAKKIEQRAIEKKKEENAADAAGGTNEDEYVDLAELPKEDRLGPGGLDPLEVFESLPDEMKEAFQEQDTERLQRVLDAMPKEKAAQYMQQCVDSGLWVPSAQ